MNKQFHVALHRRGRDGEGRHVVLATTLYSAVVGYWVGCVRVGTELWGSERL